MYKLRHYNTILVIFLFWPNFFGIAVAAEQTYVREYTYHASEADSKLSARAIALQEVKRELLSELGTHVSSVVRLNQSVDGSQLGTEEIETLSAGVTHVEVLNETWNGTVYVLKARIKADPAEVLKSLEKMLDADKKQKLVSQLKGDVSRLHTQNIKVSELLAQTRKESTAAMAEIARLKKQLKKQQTDASLLELQVRYKQQIDTLMLNERSELAVAFYQNGDYRVAFNLFKKDAVQGDASAQYYLGLMYGKGQGVDQDYKQAVNWYKKAADQGVVYAQYIIGVSYANGVGVTQDYKQAVKWFQKAASQGYADAQNNLGLAYGKGQGVTQDYKQAVKWYQKAADQGHISAQYNLGLMYDKGDGVIQDYKRAAKWYQKAANQGRADAQYNLGMMYINGQGVTQDYKQAARWTKKAAEQGDADAQYILGLMYGGGMGVTQNHKQAAKWFQKAADQGHSSAQEELEKL